MKKIANILAKRSGFSLLEVLMVMFIVGVFSAGGLYSYGKYVDESRYAAARAEAAMVNMAMAQYDVSVAKLTESSLCGKNQSTCLSNLKTNNYITSDLAFNGKYGCTGSFKTEGKYLNGAPKYVFYYSGCSFHSGAIDH